MMNKSAALLPILFLLVLDSAVAQTSDLGKFENTVTVGIGPTFFGRGDIIGIMQYTGISRQLFPYLQVGAGFSLAQASSTSEFWQQTAANTLDFHIAFIPLRLSRQHFKIGAGISRRHVNDIYYVGYSSYGNNPVLLAEFEKQEYNAFGYTALLEYEYLFGERWIIGTRASFQNYKEGSTVLFLGITGGINF